LGMTADQRFERFARLLFDWFRCPIVEVTVTPGEWLAIRRLRPRALGKLTFDARAFFREALHQHTKRDWRSPRVRPSMKYSLAVLHDPKDSLAPSSTASLKHFARIAEKHDIEVEPITRKQFH